MDALGGLVLFAGLSGVTTTIIDDYLGPAFLVVVACVGVFLAWKREFRTLIGFVGICIIAALLIFAGNTLFGKSGKLKKAAEGVATKVNVVQVLPLGGVE